jgi:tetratricopeptide (TPR) repeat protein
MDPEDLREVISAYQNCVAETVRRFDGFVARYMGDGVLVYFGYPRAREDDAERAVQAGLELIAAVTALASPVSLQTRIGIATGLVVIGNLIGTGEAQERGIVGETPNLAARLQQIAAPNTVVIDESTRKLVGNFFELENLGGKDLKGIPRSVLTWTPLRANVVESRFEALHPAGLTTLIGREKELELLLRLWSTVKSGEGQVVLLSGEAGVGKSRLTAALLESIAGEPHTRLRYFCSPQHTDSAFYSIIGQMERAAGLLHDDTPQQKLDKLDALLAQTSTSIQDAALIAEVLSLPNDGRYPALELTPQQRRQKTLEALTAQMETLSRQKPVLMILEDAHWADPTSLEAFGRVVDRIRTFRVLLLVTFRPEFDAPWVGRPYVTALIINRLAEHEASAMIDRIVGDILEHAQVALKLEVMLAQAMIAGKGYSSPETMQVLLRAKKLITAETETSRRFTILYGMWACYYVGGEVDMQHVAATEFLSEAETHDDTAALCLAHRALGTTYFTMGEFSAARKHLERAQGLYDPDHHLRFRFQYGQDIGTTAMCYLSWALWHLGYVDQASQLASKAVKRAEAISHPFTLVYTLCHARGMMDVFRRGSEDTKSYAGP